MLSERSVDVCVSGPAVDEFREEIRTVPGTYASLSSDANSTGFPGLGIIGKVVLASDYIGKVAHLTEKGIRK